MANLTSPGNNARNSLPPSASFLITPDNANDLPSAIRQITINVAGTISYLNWNRVACATDILPAGTYAMEALRINATGTTATNLTGWN